MRTKKICTIPEEFVQAVSSEACQKIFHFSLITPMFGGDAESWRLSLSNPIRGQSVKGHLRFWWRTLQDETDVKKLIQKENSIWGGRILDKDGKEKSIKSRVSLSISDIKLESKNIVVAQMLNDYAVKDDIIPGYVLFPITSEVKSGEEIHMVKTLEFSITLDFPQKLEPVILKTLKLWTLFGGVGARTRRGTGSLYCEELLEEFQKEQDIVRFIDKAVNKKETGSQTNTAPLDYPRLNGCKFYAAGDKNAEPAAVWHNFLESYGRYRQDRNPGSGKKRGRSYWPEPDAIRLLTKEEAKNHAPVHPDQEWFPRSAMGLPFISMFITPGDPGNTGGGKKKNITLEPDIGTGGRFPSPVILKVIQLPNKQVIKCALVLNQLFPKKLKLSLNGFNGWSKPVKGKMLPFHKDYKKHKIMNTKNPLNGRSIYQSLADHLALTEVKLSISEVK